MIRVLALIALMNLLAESVSSQNLEVYDGYLGNMPVAFFLNTHVSDVTGYYFYNKYGRPIPLKGHVVDGQYRLTEFSTNDGRKETISKAEITWNRSERPVGKWISGSKVLEVNLVRRVLNDRWKWLSTKIELIHKFLNQNEATYPMEIRMIYPDEGGNGIFNVLLSDFFLVDPLYHEVWPYLNNFLIKEYENYLSFFSEDSYQKYFMDMKGHVVFLSGSLLVYCKSGYAFCGGAHGQPLEEYCVYDLRKLSRITFDDIFKKGSEYALAEIIKAKDIGNHDIDDIRENLDNFYLTEKGIGFVFNPYDIDCYGCGTFEFFISLDEIRHLLK